MEYIMDLLYPRNITCVLCHEESDDELCNICKGSIQFNIGRVCKYCGRMLLTEYDVCKNCMLLDRYFDRGTSVVTYDDYVKRLFFKLKYHNKRYIAHTMAKYILHKIISLELDQDFDGIIPIPLHKNRLLKRGYNQSDLISKFLGDMTGLEVIQPIMRIKDTLALNKLSREERLDVLCDAFQVTGKLSGSYILVDDIFTTGSTVNVCSKLLKERGVDYLLVATFAVGE